AVAAAAVTVRLDVVRMVLLATTIWAILCAPIVPPYRTASRVVGSRSVSEVRDWSAVPSDFLRAHPNNAIYGDDRHPGTGERRLFPGFATPILSLIALAPPFSTATLAYGAIAVASADLAL